MPAEKVGTVMRGEGHSKDGGEKSVIPYAYVVCEVNGLT